MLIDAGANPHPTPPALRDSLELAIDSVLKPCCEKWPITDSLPFLYEKLDPVLNKIPLNCIPCYESSQQTMHCQVSHSRKA